MIHTVVACQVFMTVHYAYSDLAFIVIFNFCNFLGVDSFPLCKVDYLKLSLFLCVLAICVGCVSVCMSRYCSNPLSQSDWVIFTKRD